MKLEELTRLERVGRILKRRRTIFLNIKEKETNSEFLFTKRKMKKLFKKIKLDNM